MATKYETFTIRSIHKMATGSGQTTMLRGQFYSTTSKKLQAVEDIYLTQADEFKVGKQALAFTGMTTEEINQLTEKATAGKVDIYQHTELVLKYEGRTLTGKRITTTQI